MELLRGLQNLRQKIYAHSVWPSWLQHYKNDEEAAWGAFLEVLRDMDAEEQTLTEERQILPGTTLSKKRWTFPYCDTTPETERTYNENRLVTVFEAADGKDGGVDARNAVNLEIAAINMKYNMDQDKAREELKKEGEPTFKPPRGWNKWEPSEKLAKFQEVKESRRLARVELQRRADTWEPNPGSSGFSAHQFQSQPQARGWLEPGQARVGKTAQLSQARAPRDLHSEMGVAKMHGGGGGKKNRRRKSTKGKKKRRRSKKKKQSKRRRRT